MKNYYFLLSLIIFLASCAHKSALSDVDLEDPSLVSVDVIFEHCQKENGKLEEKIEVRIKDKNGDYVEVKNGSVKINDVALEVTEGSFSNLPIYKVATNTLTVQPDKTYKIVIQMSDGEEYTTTYKTQFKEITFRNLPTKHNERNPLDVKWEGGDKECNLYLKTTKVVDLVEGGSRFEDDEHPIDYPEEDEYRIIPDFFHYEDGVVEDLQISLESVKNGQFHPKFRSESQIESIFRVEKNIIIESQAKL